MASGNPHGSQFKTVEHADGVREFILPALRNFQEKISFSIVLLLIGGFFAVIEYALSRFNDLPMWLRFFTIDWIRGSLWAVLVPVQLILIYAVLNMWLRSSRIFVRPNEMRVVTHWLFLKRTRSVPLAKMIGIRLENNASDGGILYYDVVAIVSPEDNIWFRILEFARGLGLFKNARTDEERILAATNIKGKEEAERLLREINKTLGRAT